MKSLLIAPTLPSDAGNGLAMRVGVFLEALRRLGEVKLLVLPVFGADDTTNALCQRLGVRPHLISLTAETHFAIVRGLSDPQARLRAFIDYGKPSAAAFLSVAVLRDIRTLVAERAFDLVHIARSYLLPVIDAWPEKNRPVVSVDLDEDDVRTHQRIAALHANRGDRLAEAWQEAEAVAFDRLLKHWISRADMACISTERERDAVEARYGVRPLVIANSIAPPPTVARRSDDRSLLFVGGFGYFPNLDAAMWLLESVLPVLTTQSPDPVSLTLVGRNPPPQLTALAAKMKATVLDNVDDLAPIYARSSIALVPLRAGGGSRIKLLEAAAHGVPIVATTIGAEGSGLTDGRHIAVADTPEGLAGGILRIWEKPGEAAQRAAAAHVFVKANFSRAAIISTLKQRFATELTQRAAHPGELP